MIWLDALGYVAAFIIAVSMAMSSVVRLRLLGLIGASLFSVYGILIASIPVFLLNGFIAVAHSYYLYQIKNQDEYFEIMRVPDINTPFLLRFVKFYQDEIQHYFPNFSLANLKRPIIIFVFRNMIPAGLFIAEPRQKETLEIIVDYVTPGFRDLKSAHFIFYKSKKLFGTKGYRQFIARAFVKKHKKYLKKMGFKEKKIEDKNYFAKQI